MTVDRKLQSVYFDDSTQDGYCKKIPQYHIPANVFRFPGYEDAAAWKAANPDKLPSRFPGDPDETLEPAPLGDDLPPLVINSGRELLAREPQPVDELIPGRIEKNAVNFLSGAGGSHKSRLGIQYGACVQARVPIFGATPGVATSVNVSAEDDANEVRRRVHKIVKRLGLPPGAIDGFRHIDRYGLGSALVTMKERGPHEFTPFYNQLGNYLTGLPGHKFVVLDSCYDFVRFEGSAKINEDAVNTFIKEVLAGFARATDATLLVPWHPSQAGQERGDGTGWSVAWHNAPRVRDVISRIKGTDSFELKAVKRSHGALPPPLILHYADGALLPLSEFDTSQQKAQLDAACVNVAIACAKQNMPITQQRRVGKAELDMLRERIEIDATDAEFKDILKRAVHDGKLVYVKGTSHKNAGYYPPDKAEELAQRRAKL